MRTMDSFPLDDLLASRADVQLQIDHAVEVAAIRVSHRLTTACSTCGAADADLAWFYFSSPTWTWQKLCGRAGVVAFCDRDREQVAAFISMIN